MIFSAATNKGNDMITTTLKALRENGACYDGYNKVVRKLQGKEFSEEDANRSSYIAFSHYKEIPLSLILESNGIDDALWALRACEQTPELQRAERLFGVWCARQVQYLMTDQRSIDALDVAERFANGEATEEELAAARAAAWDAARDAASYAASDAALAAARAARDAASYAASDAALAAARAASYAASDAALAAARAAASDAQKQKFTEVFCGDGAPNVDAFNTEKSVETEQG